MKNKFYVRIDTYDGYLKRIFEYDGLDEKDDDEISTKPIITVEKEYNFWLFKISKVSKVYPSKGIKRVIYKFGHGKSTSESNNK